MQIIFGSPSLSLTFSWAAPDKSANASPLTLTLSRISASSEPDTPTEVAFDERELLGKPFELTLARCVTVLA